MLQCAWQKCVLMLSQFIRHFSSIFELDTLRVPASLMFVKSSITNGRSHLPEMSLGHLFVVFFFHQEQVQSSMRD